MNEKTRKAIDKLQEQKKKINLKIENNNISTNKEIEILRALRAFREIQNKIDSLLGLN